ncbi:MAG: putative hydrolase of the superfamily [Microbacteriaceae bacterium]|nr:putative hydrolase of the superfamily [Microbacteriaceae bacterium]
MSGASVVLFDLDDTLFAHRAAVALAVTAHRHNLGGTLADADDTAEVERWRLLEELHYHRYLAGEVDYLAQRRARARDFVAPFDLDLADDAHADRWFDEYRIEYERSWALHDDAIPCLEQLRAEGRRIGIITNGDLAFQQSKVKRVGLAPLVERVIASGDLGVAKPDRRIFEHACQMFGVAPADAVYVGDRLATDAIGAAEAGLIGVWLDRPRAATDAQRELAAASAVLVIDSLEALPALLAGSQ